MKFSLAEDERPVLATRAARSRRWIATSSGSRSPARWRSPTSCSRSRRAGCGSAAGSRTSRAGRAAAPALARTRTPRRAAAELAGRATEVRGAARPPPRRPSGAASPTTPRRSGAPRRPRATGRRRSTPRRRARCRRALARRAAPVGRGRVERADDDRRRPLRRRSRRSAGSTSRSPSSATNHLTDTKTHRYFFDRAFLAVQPGHDRVQDQQPRRHAARRASTARHDHVHPAPDRLRQAARRRRDPDVHADVRHPGPGRRADPGDPDRDEPRDASARGASAATGRPGGRSRSSSRPGSTSTSTRAELGAPTTDAAGNARLATGRLAEPADVLRLLRRRSPERYKETTLQVPIGGRDRSRSRSGPGPTTRPGPSASAAS